MRSDRKLSVLALACALGGCLPPGEPPAGRHLVHDRTLSGVFLSPSEQEGVPSYVLATGPLQSTVWDPQSGDSVTTVEVYHFADARPDTTIEGLAQVEPTIADVYLPDADPTSAPFRTDSRGRLFYVAWNLAAADPMDELFGLWRLDLGNGEAEVVGLADAQGFLIGEKLRAAGADRPMTWLQSPGRTQLFTDFAPVAVIGLDTRQNLGDVRDPTFIGEDFYYAGSTPADPIALWGDNIIRVKPGAEPEVLPFSSTGWAGLRPVVGNNVSQLLLTIYTLTGWRPVELLDTETLEHRSIPSELRQAEFLSVSPSGQLLLFRQRITDATETQPAEYRLFILEWASGGYVTLDAASIGKGLRGDSDWRPGTSDLWVGTLPGLAIWRPDNTVTTLDTDPYWSTSDTGRHSFFTADGHHWFSLEVSGPRLTVYVGSADDPHAPRLRLNPPGTEMNRCWLLADGRLLLEAWASSSRRNDIYLVDADAGTSRALGSAGQVVAVGQRRALALLNWQLSRSTGELVLIDFASGSRRVLAPDVYAVAVDSGTSASVPPGTDALAPGTRVVFLSRNRLESRDDGLWVTELP